MNFRSIFKDLRGFLLLWSSQTVSALGTAMTEYALIVWVYEREGSASSVTLLTICIFLPTIFFRFIGGALADRWDKKRIMLLSDLIAACGTLTVLMLFSFSALRVLHLYVIDFFLSFLNAFQAPASFVATSALVPKQHYTRAAGLQGISGSAVAILAPALGALLLAVGGLKLVLLCDLATFAFAFLVLALFIRIPETPHDEDGSREPFLRSCTQGVRWLRAHKALARLALLFAAVNFLAKLGSDGMLSPFILARTGNDQPVLGMVQSATAAGVFAGSLLVTGMKPPKRKTDFILLLTACVFAGNVVQSLTVRPWIWAAAAFVSYLTAAVMNANLTVLWREQVPIEVQGRVFAARDTLQNGTIPFALFLGGILADRVLEPFMASDSPVQRFLSTVFGQGSGSGIAVMFFCVGVLGIALCLTRLAGQAGKETDKS